MGLQGSYAIFEGYTRYFNDIVGAETRRRVVLHVRRGLCDDCSRRLLGMQRLCLFRVVQGRQYVGDLNNVQAEGMYMQVCAAGLCRSCMHLLRRTTFIKDSANFGKVTDTLGSRSP